MIQIASNTDQTERRERTPPVGVKWHPLAELFPWIEGPARAELKADIAKNGVLEPIVFLGEFILDGRNRYDIARELGMPYPRVEYTGPDPLAFVLAKNLARRHLTESQRAMVAARLAKMPQGARTDLQPSANLPEVSQPQAASMLNVSERSLRTAKIVQEDGAPELVAAVESGKVSVSAAAEVASLPVEEQSKVVAAGETKEAAKAIKAKRAADKAAQQAVNDAARANTVANLNPAVKAAQEAKAAAIASRKPVDSDALVAELEQARETIAEQAKDIERLTAENRRFDDMRVQFEKGGFEEVIAGKDETIRVLQTRVESESAEKVRNLRSADWWKRKAIELGYSRDEVIDLEALHG